MSFRIDMRWDLSKQFLHDDNQKVQNRKIIKKMPKKEEKKSIYLPLVVLGPHFSSFK